MIYRYSMIVGLFTSLMLVAELTYAGQKSKGNPGDEVPPEIDILSDRVDAAENDISTLKFDVSTVQTDLGNVQTDLGNVQTDLTTLQGEVTSLDTELGIVDTRVLDLEDGLQAIAESRIVFVTETSYTGNLGGLAGADEKCQSAAGSAALGGTFLAWLSTWGGPIIGTPVVDPQIRFIRHNVPYVLVNGAKVADNYADFVDGTLDAPIDRTENDTQLFSGNLTWSTTAANGRAIGALATTTCENWSTDAFLTTGSYLGTVGATDFFWSAPGLGLQEPCFNKHRLLCVQQ